MKNLIIALYLFVPILHAEKHDYNFEYYKAKTIEILSALDIATTDLTFINTEHNPSIEQRQKNPYVVFINVKKLNELFSQREAIFECLVEAQLSRISQKSWETIINLETHYIQSIPWWLAYALLSPFACYILKWSMRGSQFSPLKNIPFTLLTLASTAASMFLFLNRQNEVTPFSVIKKNFERKKFLIQLNMVRTLFNSHTYAPLGIYGFISTKWQYIKMKGAGIFPYIAPEFEYIFENMANDFTRWTETHPDILEKIATTNHLTV